MFDKYVKGTGQDAIVQYVVVLLCNLTVAVVRGVGWPCNRAYINTRVLKHMYDKKPAEEFDFLVQNLHAIIKYPDKIYRNKGAKRGHLCFLKKIKNHPYFCSLELVEEGGAANHCQVVTCFRVRKENYLDDYELLWEWKGGNLHRSAFDSGQSRPNGTPQ